MSIAPGLLGSRVISRRSSSRGGVETKRTFISPIQIPAACTFIADEPIPEAIIQAGHLPKWKQNPEQTIRLSLFRAQIAFETFFKRLTNLRSFAMGRAEFSKIFRNFQRRMFKKLFEEFTLQI
jgi:hypothetical protein